MQTSKLRQLAATVMNPKDISIGDYTYQLPTDRIAEYPLPERDASKLLIYEEGQITEDCFRNLTAHIPANSLLVFNNSKVVEARIVFHKPGGARIELFCLEPDAPLTSLVTAVQRQARVRWKCLIGGASKWKPGQVLEKEISMDNRKLTVHANYIEKKEDCFVIEFSWDPPELHFTEILHLAGQVPLPPYIKRETAHSDSERYQTIYARHDGSVAAPTAGLHFTGALFSELAEKHIPHTFVTLHVGAGTFKPVTGNLLSEHIMHAEYIDIPISVIKTLLHHADGYTIPVGTTSLRTLESLYWLGVKTILQPGIQPGELSLGQWDAYNLAANAVAPAVALRSLLSWSAKHQLENLVSQSQLLICPGYDFRICHALITNFHLPNSTLLLLVAAMVGEEWRKIYQYALDRQFRFLSYGDACLLFGKEKRIKEE